jgi:CheY-like chemotaxis protein
MRIAYVEDNPTNLALVERIARMTSHAIVSYKEGEEALIALKAEIYDLILMDVELAGAMNGLQVVRELRKHGLRTPIVAVTAYAMMGDRDKCLAAGCNEYLPKPLPINDFIGLLARYDAVKKVHGSTIVGEGNLPAPDVAATQASAAKVAPPTPAPAEPAPASEPAPTPAPAATVASAPAAPPATHVPEPAPMPMVATPPSEPAPAPVIPTVVADAPVAVPVVAVAPAVAATPIVTEPTTPPVAVISTPEQPVLLPLAQPAAAAPTEPPRIEPASLPIVETEPPANSST